jgi:hypothetical protein
MAELGQRSDSTEWPLRFAHQSSGHDRPVHIVEQPFGAGAQAAALDPPRLFATRRQMLAS